MSTLYSPFVTISEAVAEFLKSKDQPELLQNFCNSWLAEPWEDAKLRTTSDMVLERQTDLPELVVPSWAKRLCGGVDVQETSLYWTVRAFGDYFTSQNIAHGQVLSWAGIEQAMNREYVREDGTKMVVSLALIDSGDQTDAVYDFCGQHLDWTLPVKGSSKSMMSYYKITTVDRKGSMYRGRQLCIVDGGKYKDMIASRMRRRNGTGSWMVYKGCDREYAEQVTAEQKVAHRTKTGGVEERWELRRSHADNHYLDCEVYATAAADLLGARSWHLEEEQETQSRIRQQAEERRPAQQQDMMPEETWIGKHDDWLR